MKDFGKPYASPSCTGLVLEEVNNEQDRRLNTGATRSDNFHVPKQRHDAAAVTSGLCAAPFRRIRQGGRSSTSLSVIVSHIIVSNMSALRIGSLLNYSLPG